jgi:hypothetical protein
MDAWNTDKKLKKRSKRDDSYDFLDEFSDFEGLEKPTRIS